MNFVRLPVIPLLPVPAERHPQHVGRAAAEGLHVVVVTFRRAVETAIQILDRTDGEEEIQARLRGEFHIVVLREVVQVQHGSH